MNRVGNLFLIGPMGAGKSTVGRHLADLLHKEFLDSDHEVERRTGAAIPLIFEIEGEAGFRRRESDLIAELSERDNIVLATGGGAILAESNRELLRSRGTVIYLQAPLDTLLNRMHRDKGRPLLQQGDRRLKLEEILQVREPIYRSLAHVIIATDHRAPALVAQEIANKLQVPPRHENTTS